ncbi:tetratricopeptide repeat protein [Flavivirga jejuensis]|uniref:Tetratricopeptide repeat protein n=1 Tax=Flavivirga jejuensis TaxID=870487 RepID=A0ABT8WP28_9FLAO|nr:hypothetical protein [Flavivirga jejuensis]MDO5974909.1 hypothetical protein [Flavivirga jejuensis]
MHGLKGRIFNKKQLYDQALEHINKAIALGIETNQNSLSELYSILGQLYIYKKEYKKAINILEKWKSLYLYTVTGNESDNFMNLGIAYSFIKKYKKAEKNILQSYYLHKENKDTLKLAYSCTEIANLYYIQYKDSLALPYFKEALEYAKKSHDLVILQNTYLNMAVIEENKKNYAMALSYRKDYEKIKDSIWDRDKIWRLSQKDKKIATISNDQKLKEEQKKRVNTYI